MHAQHHHSRNGSYSQSQNTETFTNTLAKICTNYSRNHSRKHPDDCRNQVCTSFVTKTRAAPKKSRQHQGNTRATPRPGMQKSNRHNKGKTWKTPGPGMWRSSSRSRNACSSHQPFLEIAAPRPRAFTGCRCIRFHPPQALTGWGYSRGSFVSIWGCSQHSEVQLFH